MKAIDRKRAVRDPAIEWIKLIAIIAIVFQHSVHAQELGSIKILTHGAVPMFTFLSTYFAVCSGIIATNIWVLAWKRTVSLYFLFLSWNSVYFAIRLFASRAGADSSFQGFSWDYFLLSGYANAMWFLPFILIANISGFIIGHLASKISAANSRAIAFSFMVAALLAGFIPQGARIGPDVYLFTISTKAIPSLLLGLAFGLGFRDWIRVVSSNSAIILICFFSMLISGGLLIAYGRIFYLFENIFGLSMLFFSLALASPYTRVAIHPNLALWIFVSHPLFLHGLRKISNVFGWNWDTSAWVVHAFGFVCLIMALIFAYRLLMKVRVGPFVLAQPTSIDRQILRTITE